VEAELLNLYRQAGDWTAQRVVNATDLDGATPCDDWNVRDLLNHMLDTQRYFLSTARGESGSLPGPNPPDLVGDDPVASFDRMRSDVIDAFSRDGAIERTGPALGIAFADQLLHGWDLARSTGQDDTMPEGLPQAAYDTIHGQFTEEQRKGVFKPEIAVGDDATPQQRLLAYTGRDPG